MNTPAEQRLLVAIVADLKAENAWNAKRDANAERAANQEEERATPSDFIFEDDDGYMRAPKPGEVKRKLKRREKARQRVKQQAADAIDLTQRLAESERAKKKRRFKDAREPWMIEAAKRVRARPNPDADCPLPQEPQDAASSAPPTEPAPATAPKPQGDLPKGAKRPPTGERYPVVRISNSLRGWRNPLPLIRPRGVKIRHELCRPRAAKVIVLIFSYVDAPRDGGFAVLETNAYRLGKAIRLGYRMDRSQAQELLREVARVVFTCTDADGREAYRSAVDTCFDTATGLIRIKVRDWLRPYLLDLRSNYRSLLPGVYDLQTLRGVPLYEFLRRFPGLLMRLAPERRWHTVTVKELYSELCVDEEVPWSEFHKDILRPTLTEIQARTELRVKYEPVRDGARKRGGIVAVRFKVEEDGETVKKLIAGFKGEAEAAGGEG